jgi:hypothetical protein
MLRGAGDKIRGGGTRERGWRGRAGPGGRKVCERGGWWRGRVGPDSFVGRCHLTHAFAVRFKEGAHQSLFVVHRRTTNYFLTIS